MSRLPRTLAAVCAVGLAAYALVILLDAPPTDETSGALVPQGPTEAQARAEARDRLVEYVRAVEQTPAVIPGDDLVDDDGVPTGLDGVGEDDARQGFEHIMKRVEALGRKRRRLSQDEWRQTYRAANDAFAALSNHLDGRDARQRAELEDAYARLKVGLESVKVRGQKLGHPGAP
jgi:hypothetical protein